MIKRTILGLTAVVVGLTGCGSSDSEPYAESSAIRILPQISRVTGLRFDVNDRIGLTIVTDGTTEYVRNRMLSYSGSCFEASDLLWYGDAAKPATLTAYYPYSAPDVPLEFSVAADQTAGCAPSCLLVAVKENVLPSAGAVGMTFSRLCSSILINIDNKSGAEVTKVVVGGTVAVASTDIGRKAIQAKAGVAPAEITACPLTAGKAYEAVVIPQTAAISVTFHLANGKVWTKTLASAKLDSGMQYTLAVEITADQVKVALSGDITNWGDGGALGDSGNSGGGVTPDPGGDGSPEEGAGTLTYQGEEYKTVQIAGRTWMAENLRYIPNASLIGKGVWYPVKDGVECSDPACIKVFGVLYNFAVATAGATVAAGTPVQGICPVGWQLPDDALLQSLISDKSYDFETFAPSGGFWNSTLGQYGTSTKSYLLGVGAATGGKYNYLLFVTGNLQPSVAALSPDYGVAVRCVKSL